MDERALKVHKLDNMEEISKDAPLELTIKLAVLVLVSSHLLPLRVFDVDDSIRLRHRGTNLGTLEDSYKS